MFDSFVNTAHGFQCGDPALAFPQSGFAKKHLNGSIQFQIPFTALPRCFQSEWTEILFTYKELLKCLR